MMRNTAARHDSRSRLPTHLLDEKDMLMKKQAMLTAVASLLTFASVAVLPAFAQDTGGKTYNPMPRQEYSRYGGEHERHHGKGEWRGHGYGYGYSNPDSRTYGYGKDKQDKERYEQEKSKGSGYSNPDSRNYGSGYGYRNYGYGYSR